MTIVNYAFSNINKLKALHTNDARVVIYDRHVFIVQATSFIVAALSRNESAGLRKKSFNATAARTTWVTSAGC
jgi:hypothetical protein